MIILVTLMVVASRVLSIPIDDVPDSSYVAIDSAVPVQLDPATITRLYREQSSYPVSSPPFNEGFYYTVPARLLLYQPPPGQSYPAGRANANNQHNPNTVGENVQSSQRLYKRSYAPARISADELPSGNFPGGAAQYANYYDPSSDYHHLSAASSIADGFSGSSGYSDVRSAYNYRSPNLVQGSSGNEERYSQKLPVSYGNSKHTISRGSQDYQNAQVSQSVGYLNNRLQGSWPQSTGPIPDPEDYYGIRSSQNLHEQYPSGPNPYRDNGSQFPLYEELNIQQHGEPIYAGESSETVRKQEGVRVGSGLGYHQASRNFIPGSQSHQMVNHRGDGSNSFNLPSPVDDIPPHLSQISPSYLVGLKLLTKTPALSAQRHPVWDSPYFPKHMVEPWASKLYEDGAYSASRYGFQSRPVESSRAAGPSPNFGFRPPPSGSLSGTKAGTPWVVLMVPPESLFRKDMGMKIPWLSLNDGEGLSFSRAGTPPCQKENLSVAQYQPSQSNMPREIKHTLTNEPQRPISGSWESQPLLGQINGLEGTTQMWDASALSTKPFIKPQFQNQQASSQVIQDQSIMANGNATVEKYISSGSSGTQQLIEHPGEDHVITRVFQNDAAREVHPSGAAQAIIEGVVINGTPMHQITSGSQQLAGQSSMGGTEGNRERLQAEIMILGSDSSSKMINYADSSSTGAKQMVDEGATLPDTNQIEGAHVASELKSISSSGMSSASNLDRSTTVVGENLVQNMESQMAGELVHPIGSTQVSEASSGSNFIGSVDTGMTEQVSVNERNMIVGGEGSSAMINYAQSGDLATQRIIQQGSGLVSTTTLTGGAPSSSKIVPYTASEGVVQENLGEAGLGLRTGGSSTVMTYTNSGSTIGQQIIEQGPETMKTQIEGGSSTSEVVRYVTEGVPGQEFMDQANTLGSTTAYRNGAPSNSETLLYVTSGGNEGEHLGESKIVLENGGSSTVTRYITSGSTDSQQIIEEGQAPQTMSTLVDGGVRNDQSTVVKYGYTDISGSQAPNGLGSTTTILGGAPSTSKIIRYESSPGALGENLGETNIALANKGSSTITRYSTTGSTVSQQIDEEGLAPQTISTLVEEGNSGSQVMRYVTEGSNGTTSQLRGIPSGTEGHSEVVKYNLTGYDDSQQVTEQANSLESKTTILSGAPSTLKTIQYVTTGKAVEENLGETKIAMERGGSSTVARYDVTTDSTGTQPRIERSDTIQSLSTSTILDGPHMAATGGEVNGSISESNIAWEKVENSPVTQVSEPSTVQLIKGGSSSQTEVNQVDAVPSSSQVVRYVTEGGMASESQSYNAFRNESNSTPYVINTVEHQVVEQPNPVVSTSILEDGAYSNPKIIRYTVGDGERQGSEVEFGPNTSTQYTISGGTAPVTTTIVKGAPITSKVIRYIITADGQRQEIADDSSLAHENIGLSSVTGTNPSVGVMGVVPKSTTTFVNGAPTTTKVIRYITTADGQTQEIVDESNLTLGNEGLSSVTGTNPSVGVMGVVPKSTTTFVNGAPTTTKVIRYITTADGQMQEIVDESNLTLGNEGLSSMADTNPAGAMGVVSKSTTTIVQGAPITSKVIRYIITADGQRQEIVDESNLALVAQPSAEGTGQIANDGNEFQLTGTLRNGQSGSQTIRYLKSGGMEQQLGQPMTTGKDGQSSVTSFFRTGSAGAQEVIDQNTASESITTLVGESPATYKTIKYVSSDGAETQQMVGTSNTNQPSQTIIRYVTGADGDSSGHLHQGGSTVTRYVSSGGSSSQFLSGPGNLQSKTIVAGSPSTVTRYGMNYPQQSGSTGMRYVQSFQPRQTSTIMKPATYSSGAQSSRSYVLSPASTVVKK